MPTADVNAVTESAVTTVSSSLFQSATFLTKNKLLYYSVLLSGILKSRVLRMSCLATVLSESLPLQVIGWIKPVFVDCLKSAQA